MKAIIIDDEERAIRVLRELLKVTAPDVEVLAEAQNVPQGVLAINRNRPDVVFLDIEMPDYSGFELLDFFRNVDFEIIFTTAYSQYAVKAFEVSAVDYILKPVQIPKLETALEKVRKKRQNTGMGERLETLKENLKEETVKKIALPVSDGHLFVNINDIVNLKAEGAYTQVYTKDGLSVLISKNLKHFEDMLRDQSAFFRPHRSHIININFLKKYSRNSSLITLENNQTVGISGTQKAEFEKLIEKLHL